MRASHRASTATTIYPGAAGRSSGISRRSALAWGTAAAAAVGLPGLLDAFGARPAWGVNSPLQFASPILNRWVTELPKIPTSDASTTLVAAEGGHRFHPDLPVSRTWGFGGMPYLGPTLIAHEEQPTTLTVVNQLGMHPLAKHFDYAVEGTTADDVFTPRLTVHLHGGLTEPGSDGHPMDTMRPGQTKVHHYRGQQAAGLWYHDHAMGITRLNVYAGLAGVYLVRDRFDTGDANNTLGLPSGEFEMPLVLQDKIFTSNGELGYRLARYVPEGNWEGGQAGDVPVVNGAAFPHTQVARGLYRFRLYNASNARGYRLRWTNGVRMWVIGHDQGLNDSPVALDSISLVGGERADVLVDFSSLAPGESSYLLNDAPLSPQFTVGALNPKIDEMVKFTATTAHGFTGPVPTTLRGGPNQPPRLKPLVPTSSRNLSILQIADTKHWPPALMTMNNLPFGSRDNDHVRPGSTEIWNLVNITIDTHPVHLHLANVRVLERVPFNPLALRAAHPRTPYGTRYTPNGLPFRTGRSRKADAWETGDKDTFDCPPGMITRVVVRWPDAEELGFDPDATFSVPDTISGGAAGVSHLAARNEMPNSGPLDAVPDLIRDAGQTRAGKAAGQLAEEVAGRIEGRPAPTASPSPSATPNRLEQLQQDVSERFEELGNFGRRNMRGHGEVSSADSQAAHVARLSENVQPTPNTMRGYVWHCHVLDHEDHDMMQAIRVTND